MKVLKEQQLNDSLDNIVIAVNQIRGYFEDFLVFWGLDFSNSYKLWDLYLKFEIENFNYFDSVLEKEAKTSNENIRKIYHRRLDYPHVENDLVWKEYQEWEKNKDLVKTYEIIKKKVILICYINFRMTP